MPRRAHRVLFTALVLTMAAGCTVGPSSRPAIVMNDGAEQPQRPATDRGPAPLPPLESPNSRLNWQDCAQETAQRQDAPPVPQGMRVECARTLGVLDSPQAPGSGVSRIAMLRIGQGKTPLVVLNDVDGLPGTLHAVRLAAQLPPDMLRTFSLIGVDRRGTGESDAARCIPEQARDRLVNIDPAVTDVEPTLDAAREAGKECSITLETQFSALDTERTAADLETVRQRLGVPHLNAIGRGEGSRVLSMYAQRHPERTGRLVLDGAPDPGKDELAAAEETAAGAQATYDAFAAECTGGGCPLAPDPHQALRELLDQLRDRPLRTDFGGTIGPGGALTAVLRGLADRDRWPELTDALARARRGDGAGLAEFLRPLFGAGEEQPPWLDGALITGCNDRMDRLPPDRVKKTAAEWRGKYPLFGGFLAGKLVWCTPWSVRSAPLPAPDGKGLPPVVVISTRADPVTPERGTLRAAEGLDTSVRLSWQGAGHGAVGQSECVTEAVRAFLADGRIPHDNTPCPA